MDKYLNKFRTYLYSPFLLTDTSQTLTCTLPFIPNCLPMNHWISNTIPTLNPSYLLPIIPHPQHSYTSHHILSDKPNTLPSHHYILSYPHNLFVCSFSIFIHIFYTRAHLGCVTLWTGLDQYTWATTNAFSSKSKRPKWPWRQGLKFPRCMFVLNLSIPRCMFGAKYEVLT